VLSQGHGFRTYSLRTAYNNGAGGGVVFADGTFNLPAPGAIALLGLAGFTRRRSR
jgi:xanthosine utilization system XapX-like protein